MNADISGSVNIQRKKSFLPFLYSKFYILNPRLGFSVIEILLVVAISALIGTVLFSGLLGKKREDELQYTARHIAALLREAQSKSVTQSSNANWSVMFVNTTSSKYYALRVATSIPTQAGQFVLPASIAYVTSTVPTGTSSIIFAALSGRVLVASSTTFGIYSTRNPSKVVTITVATSGAVSF